MTETRKKSVPSMSPVELADELERLNKDATPGPFIVSMNAASKEVTFDALRRDGMGEVVYRYRWRRSPSDTELDCFVRNNLPQIISTLRSQPQPDNSGGGGERAKALEEAAQLVGSAKVDSAMLARIKDGASPFAEIANRDGQLVAAIRSLQTQGTRT